MRALYKHVYLNINHCDKASSPNNTSLRGEPPSNIKPVFEILLKFKFEKVQYNNGVRFLKKYIINLNLNSMCVEKTILLHALYGLRHETSLQIRTITPLLRPNRRVAPPGKMEVDAQYHLLPPLELPTYNNNNNDNLKKQ